MKIYLKILCALLLVSCTCVVADAESKDGDNRSKQALKDLREHIKNASFYNHRKELHLDSLKSVLRHSSSPSRRWDATSAIASAYMTFHPDSALHYAELSLAIARRSGDRHREIISRASEIRALATAGIFAQALPKLQQLDTLKLTKEEKLEVWRAGRQLYSYMTGYVSEDSHIFESYRKAYTQYDDSLIANLPQSNMLHSFLEGERFVTAGNYARASKYLSQVMSSVPSSSNLFGMAAYQMAELHRLQGDEDSYVYYLALASSSDVEGAVKEGVALPTLAYWLYQRGDVDEAFQYINFALEDAAVSNARMRTVTIARMLPIIDQTYRKEIQGTHDRLLLSFVLALFLLIVSCVLMFYLVRQMKRNSRDNRRLVDLSRMQESYIGSFVSLCSSYSDRLESLTKLVTVKVAAGQTDELVRQIKSGRFGNDKDEDFYQKFDAAFLDLYPGFVDGFNALLREDERISLRQGKSLTPELRIYAFVKLGVDESTRIAQVLHYSVSTIYAYRNKMRNKAINRDTFEDDVRQICRERLSLSYIKGL